MTTGFFVFILFTTLMNLGIGFALAMHLGHGPKLGLSGFALLRFWQTLLLRRQSLNQASAASVALSAPLVDTSAAAPAASASLPAAGPTAPVDEPLALDPVQPLEGAADVTPFQEFLAKFQEDMNRHQEERTWLDQRIHDLQAAPDREAFDQCTKDLVDLNGRYLAVQQENLRLLSGYTPVHLQEIGREVCRAGKSHNAEILQSTDAIGKIEVSADNLRELCQQLLEETDGQRASSDGFRCALDSAVISIIEAEHDLVESSHNSQESRNRASAMETVIEQALVRWRDDPDLQQHPLTIALLDGDDFARINEQHGTPFGDGIIRALHGVMETAGDDAGEMLYESGPSFLVSYFGAATQDVSASLERIRQTIERTKFQQNDTAVNVTISCAAVDAQPGDSARMLCERLSLSVREAKRYGRNRTFLHDGKYPTPVMPPKLSIPDTTVEI